MTYPQFDPPSYQPPAVKQKRKWWKHPVLWTIVALLVGIGIGGAGGSTATKEVSSQAKSEPAATVTVTAAAKGAKVAPTVTVTETAPAVRITETVTETAKTPQACLDAIDEAEDLAKIMVDFTQLMSAWPEIALAAAQAGIAQDADALNAVTKRMEKSNTQLTGLTSRVSATGDAFNTAKGTCRDGA